MVKRQLFLCWGRGRPIPHRSRPRAVKGKSGSDFSSSRRSYDVSLKSFRVGLLANCALGGFPNRSICYKRLRELPDSSPI